MPESCQPLYLTVSTSCPGQLDNPFFLFTPMRKGNYLSIFQDPASELNKLANFLGIEACADFKAQIIDMCDFEKMAKDKFSEEAKKLSFKGEFTFFRKGNNYVNSYCVYNDSMLTLYSLVNELGNNNHALYPINLALFHDGNEFMELFVGACFLWLSLCITEFVVMFVAIQHVNSFLNEDN